LSQLTQFHTKAVTIDDPGRYAVQLLSDGRVSALADCGTVDGSWSDGDGTSDTLDIQIAVATVVACKSGQGQLFLLALDEATRYEISGATLTLTLGNGEEMVLTRVAAGA
jgi:heat shock protein HslJ